MLDSADVQDMTSEGRRALEDAVATRQRLRRATRRKDLDRQEQITAAITRLQDVMQPIRRAMGQIAYLRLEPGVEEDLRYVSDEIQRERRKLRKMLARPDA